MTASNSIHRLAAVLLLVCSISQCFAPARILATERLLLVAATNRLKYEATTREERDLTHAHHTTTHTTAETKEHTTRKLGSPVCLMLCYKGERI